MQIKTVNPSIGGGLAEVMINGSVYAIGFHRWDREVEVFTERELRYIPELSVQLTERFDEIRALFPHLEGAQ